MKRLKTSVKLIITTSFVLVFALCVVNSPEIDTITEVTNDTGSSCMIAYESFNAEAIIDVPETEEDIGNVEEHQEYDLQTIDERVAWINERLGLYVYKDDGLHREFYMGFTRAESDEYVDYYHGNSLVYRMGSTQYLDIEEGLLYALYYDEEGRLVFANIRKLLYINYSLYFHSDEMINMVWSDPIDRNYNESYVSYAVAVCLESAYSRVSDELNANTKTKGTLEHPVTEAEIYSIIQDVNERVNWINERLWNCPLLFIEHSVECMCPFWYSEQYEHTFGESVVIKDNGIYDDYYYNNSLVLREGFDYSDELGGTIGYELFYDIEGRLIFAFITQYRFQFYWIYFNNDAMVAIMIGDRKYSRVSILDEYMINAILLSIKNAYT